MLDGLSVFSSSILSVALIAVGIYFTIKMRFFQVLKFPICIKTVFSSIRNKDKKGIASMLLALGGTVGVGNIAGVSAAIALGGAGSVFWIWVCGIFGMITKYAEVFLSVKYRPIGPFGYIGKSFGKLGKIAIYVFGLSCIISSLFIGNVIQSKAVIDTLGFTFGFDYTVSAAFIGIPIFILAFSDADFIKKTSSIAVPFVSVLYVIMTLVVIYKNVSFLPKAVSMIFTDAFSIKPAASGVFGYLFSAALRQGISKGLFSHEAGQGSAPISYSSDSDADPYKSGCLGILEVFIDTGVISTLTAFAMLTSGFWSENGMVSAADMFISSFGVVGGVCFAVSIYLFCVAAISGWIFYAKRSIEILFNKKIISVLYSAVTVLIIPMIALFPMNVLWQLSDVFMLIMTLPNLVSLMYHRKTILLSVGK